MSVIFLTACYIFFTRKKKVLHSLKKDLILTNQHSLGEVSYMTIFETCIYVYNTQVFIFAKY